MNTAQPDASLLLDRLTRLERSHRRLRRAFIGLLATSTLVVLAAATVPPRSPEVLEASRFILKDDQGQVIARLEPVPEIGGARLVLLGKEGVAAVGLRATPVDARLALQANGVPRVDLEASIHANIGRLTFRSDDGDVRLQAQTEDGLSGVFLHSLPNEKGIKSNIGLYMPPEPDNLPRLSLRLADLRKRIWTLE